MATESRSVDSPDDLEAHSRRRKVLVWLLAAIAALFICQVISMGAPLAKAKAIKTLPASIRAQSAADYGADAKTGGVPQVNESIFIDLIMDVPATLQAGDRLGTLEARLQTPVPTMTSNGSKTPTPLPTRIPPIIETPTRTATPIQTTTFTAGPSPSVTGTPTFTSTPSVSRTYTITPSRTPTFTATATSTPSRTSTNTFTISLSPTSTYTPTRTVSPTGTFTPTHTSSPTETYTPTFTDVSIVPPTDTFTPTDTATFTHSPTPDISPTSTISAGCVEIPSGGFMASQDTWVDKTGADVSYGSDATIIIRPTAGVDQRGLIAFDLSSIPAGSAIHSAYLYLTIVTGKTYTVDFYPASASWDESTTWNTMPGYDASSKGSLDLSATACTRVAVFDAALVQAWVDGTVPNYGIYLYPPAGSGQSTFSSREGPNPPVLVVDYSMP